MAKVLGLTNTTIRGKIGNTVFFTRKGQSLARMYQPVVTNPRTSLQLSQRAKLTQSVKLNQAITTDIKRIYGTGRGSYEYQGVQKILMNALGIKLQNAPMTTDDQDTEVPINTIISGGIKFKNVDSIAQNYTAEGINIFDPGVTIKPANYQELKQGKIQPSSSTYGLSTIIYSENALLIDGTFQRITDVAEKESGTFDLYFGCDYPLGSAIVVTSLKANAVSDITRNIIVEHKSSAVEVTTIGITAQNQIGSRRRGFFTTYDNCGTDWNYYYKISFSPSTTPAERMVTYSTFVRAIGNYNNTKINPQMLNIITPSMEGAESCYIINSMSILLGTSINDINDNASIQCLKGFTKNTYLASDFVTIEKTIE